MHFLRDRRKFFESAGLGILALGLGKAGGLKEALADEEAPASAQPALATGGTVPFWSERQAGILTPQQAHSYFASFDLMTANRDDVIKLFKAWTDASARMTEGRPGAPGTDSLEALDLPPSKLTLTFGFGAGLFSKNGKDRYGLLKHKPEALIELPKFHGDELIEAKTGGDISIQACADDPQVAFHAVRHLARLATPVSYDGTAADVAQIRWAQAGFASGGAGEATPRNLMGFKDGTQQPPEKDYDHAVFVDVGRPALDARRDISGRPPNSHRARALGQERGRLSGAGHRPAQGHGRAARQES